MKYKPTNDSQTITDILSLVFSYHMDMFDDINYSLGRLFNDFVDYEDFYMNEIDEYMHTGRIDSHFFL